MPGKDLAMLKKTRHLLKCRVEACKTVIFIPVCMSYCRLN